MGNIKLLDKETINKIAAGEVIEKPASIVKELIENSIDAGATIITCEIKEGGKSFIRITDNGCGIDNEDIRTAFLRHSTSKISDENDLENIKSLGFRGEALSSISAIAKLEMLTKRAEDFLGSRYICEGGVEKIFEEAGCPDGTTFIIRDIFFNTPARRKFLKSSITEAGYISDLINRLAISHPEISFRFINQGKTILFTNGNGNEKDTLYSIYGRDVASNLIAVNYHSEMLNVTGYIGKPVILRGNRICENYYVNGRYSKSSIITKAIEEGYKGYAMQHKYPFTSLHFEFPFDKLDVNVHPSKMEVRITDGDFYYTRIYELVSNALRSSNMIVDASLNTKEKEEKKFSGISSFKTVVDKYHSEISANGIPQRISESETEYKISKTTDKSAELVEKPDSMTNQISNFNKVTTENQKEFDFDVKIKQEEDVKINALEENKQVREAEEQKSPALIADPAFISKVKTESTTNNQNKTDLQVKISESSDLKSDISVTVSDKEYEQISFAVNEEFMQQSNSSNKTYKIVGQVFGTYWIVELKENMYIIDQHAAHEKILYERTLERYRKRETISQQLYPPIIVTLSILEESVLNKYNDYFSKLGFEISDFGGREYAINAVPCDLFRITGDAFFHDLLDQLINSPVKGEIDAVIDRIATMSCKAAIKGNHNYTVAEAEILISELLKLENPYHCPHGRPVIISMTKRDIEKKFKRII